MKKLLGILLIIISISCCQDDEQSEPELYNGYATAKVNGVEYDFKPRMKVRSSGIGYNIVMNYYVNDTKRAQLHISAFTKEENAQTLNSENEDNLNPQAIYATLIGDGDVTGNYYFLNEGDEVQDFIEIISFEESSGDVTGNFEASFYVDTSFIFDPGSPDTIVISDGYFETRVVE